MAQVQTAVILAAGKGSRRLPITRVIDKAMLPVGNRPIIDYVVEQCLAGGARRIIFIVNDLDSLICKYYGSNIDLAKEFDSLGEHGNASVEYVVQDQSKLGYGTASALQAASKLLASEEYFIVAAGDGFIYSPNTHIFSDMSKMLAANSGGSIAGVIMPGLDIQKYSLIKENNEKVLEEIVEKPQDFDPNKSGMANLSYYILHNSIFDIFEKLELKNNEYYLTDAVTILSSEKPVYVCPVQGEYLDSGQLDKWVAANQHILQNGL